MITGWFYETQQRMATQIKPEDVIRLMNKAGVRFVLMGAHGISGWMEQPRSTQDVDILVQASHYRRAVNVIRKAYPRLTEEELPAVTRFTDPKIGKVVIDLMKPVEALNKEALKTAVRAGKTHRVPSLEMALACKYSAMRGRDRDALKRFVAKHNQDQIDMDVLFTTGNCIAHHFLVVAHDKYNVAVAAQGKQQFDNIFRRRAAIDDVTDEHKLISGGHRDDAQQRCQSAVATMNVAKCQDSSRHNSPSRAIGPRLIAASCPDSQKTPRNRWNGQIPA
jgi:hypothetical protein